MCFNHLISTRENLANELHHSHFHIEPAFASDPLSSLKHSFMAKWQYKHKVTLSKRQQHKVWITIPVWAPLPSCWWIPRCIRKCSLHWFYPVLCINSLFPIWIFGGLYYWLFVKGWTPHLGKEGTLTTTHHIWSSGSHGICLVQSWQIKQFIGGSWR